MCHVMGKNIKYNFNGIKYQMRKYWVKMFRLLTYCTEEIFVVQVHCPMP